MDVGKRLTAVFRNSGMDAEQAPSAQGGSVGASEKDNRQAPRGAKKCIVSGRTLISPEHNLYGCLVNIAVFCYASR
jgi:hypothetical protein